jgi:hypothetical protein
MDLTITREVVYVDVIWLGPGAQNQILICVPIIVPSIHYC